MVFGRDPTDPVGGGEWFQGSYVRKHDLYGNPFLEEYALKIEEIV